MTKKLMRYFHGYVIIGISGVNKERFLNLCRNHKLNIWNLKQDEDDTYVCHIDVDDFMRLKNIRKKTSCRVKIIRKYGIPFLINKYKYRFFFLIGILFFFVISNRMSQYIWNISVDGNYSYTEEKITSMLDENGISHGIKKSLIAGSEIEKLIRNTYADITWVSVELKGTRLIIHIKENFDRKIAEVEDEPYNLISGKEAVITSIVTRTGKPLVKAGDEVHPDTELVSGILEITGDDGSVTATEFVNSDADVYGKVVYDYSDKFSLLHEKKEYTGKKKRAFSINILGFGADFMGMPVRFKSYDIISDTSQLCIFDNYYLPAYLIKYSYREYEVVKEQYSPEEAETIANEKITLFLKDLEEKGIQIMQNNVRIEINDDECAAEGNIIVNQQLGQVQYITEEQIGQQDGSDNTDNMKGTESENERN